MLTLHLALKRQAKKKHKLTTLAEAHNTRAIAYDVLPLRGRNIGVNPFPRKTWGYDQAGLTACFKDFTN